MEVQRLKEVIYIYIHTFLHFKGSPEVKSIVAERGQALSASKCFTNLQVASI